MSHQIARLVSNGFYKEALSLYAREYFSSRCFFDSFAPLLKACGKLNLPIHGRTLHSRLFKTGYLIDVYASTALAGMYMNLGHRVDAVKVFDEMARRNAASVNVLISGFSKNGCGREAVRIFGEARLAGFVPSSVTVASVLCRSENLGLGIQIHCLAVKLGVERDLYAGTSLVTMYSGCGELVVATKVLEDIPNKSVVSYSAFLSGLLKNGFPRRVLVVFKAMRANISEEPSASTLVNVISACKSLLYIWFGKQIHGLVMKAEMQFDTAVGTALIDMYSKCKCWKFAQDVFCELSGNRNLITWNSMIAGMMMNRQFDIAVKLFEQLGSEGLEPDQASWNSMIAGFSLCGKGIRAFKYFEKMQSRGVIPNVKCVTSLLHVWSESSAIKRGKEIHGYSTRTGVNRDVFYATALIDMYMKCGSPSWARRVFDQFLRKPNDPAIWNAMISGYGKNGEYESAFEIFNQMQHQNIEPNSTTFVGVLSVCSHTGLVDKGCDVFRMMQEDKGLKPTPEHFGCMVDLLGRCGRLSEARKLLGEMSKPPASVLCSLLGACRDHLDCELGEEVATKLLELDPENPAPLVTLSNIYAALGRWKDVDRTRRLINDYSLTKLPAYSAAGMP